MWLYLLHTHGHGVEIEDHGDCETSFVTELSGICCRRNSCFDFVQQLCKKRVLVHCVSCRQELGCESAACDVALAFAGPFKEMDWCFFRCEVRC